MSRQLGPTLVSATMGTRIRRRLPYVLDQLVRRRDFFFGAFEEQSSWTCRVIVDCETFARAGGGRCAIMASLMRSAAVPCSGVFMAVRSAKLRMLGLRRIDVGDGADAAEQSACDAGRGASLERARR